MQNLHFHKFGANRDTFRDDPISTPSVLSDALQKLRRTTVQEKEETQNLSLLQFLVMKGDGLLLLTGAAAALCCYSFAECRVTDCYRLLAYCCYFSPILERWLDRMMVPKRRRRCHSQIRTIDEWFSALVCPPSMDAGPVCCCSTVFTCLLLPCQRCHRPERAGKSPSIAYYILLSGPSLYQICMTSLYMPISQALLFSENIHLTFWMFLVQYY